MPFGLKNAPATFQHLVNTVFSNQLSLNIKSYIDDMIVKSKQREYSHLADPRRTFETLRKYKMKPNPKDCVFGVTRCKVLGFLIDERSIAANPDKV